MSRLLRTEILKLLPFRTSWVIFGLFVLLIPLAFGILPNIVPEGVNVDAYAIYNFTQVWNYLPYVSAYFTTLLGILLIISISNDFMFGTLRQNIIDGLSRKDWLISKFLVVIVMALFGTLVVLLTGIVYGIFYSDAGNMPGVNVVHLLFYLLQTIGILSFSILVGVVFHRSGLSIVLYFLYTVILEPALGYLLPKGWSPYLPMNTINNLLPFPIDLSKLNAGDASSDMKLLSDPLVDGTFFLAIGYTVIFAGVSYFILKRLDL